jgi:hypothetical protein
MKTEAVAGPAADHKASDAFVDECCSETTVIG